MKMHKIALKKIIQTNNLTLEDFQNALKEVKGERMLFDRIRGHVNGFHDGKYKKIPDNFIWSLINILNDKGIINWDKVLENSICLTQKVEDADFEA